MSAEEEKAALREETLRKLRGLDAEYLAESGARAAEEFLALPEYLSGGALFCYCSQSQEIPTGGIISAALSAGRTVALPQSLKDGLMIFRVVRDMHSLRPGVFGIMEPDGGCPELRPRPGDICAVPGVCFDRRFYRLGRGGGYYDRWLAENPALKIGLCRERLLAERVPAEDFDIPMDILVTETGARKK